jgi:hypothetical protein
VPREEVGAPELPALRLRKNAVSRGWSEPLPSPMRLIPPEQSGSQPLAVFHDRSPRLADRPSTRPFVREGTE